LSNDLRTDGTSMLTLVRNVASSIGISIVIAQLTEGSRRIYAVLSEHINPFNHALQMPDVSRLINLNTDTGRALADAMVSMQAQIIAFSQDYQLIMIIMLCSIPLAIMIGSTKSALRGQAGDVEHAVIDQGCLAPTPSCPGSSRPSRATAAWKGVDARVKPGHDDGE
jgi:DHA2 family multidrug resistance protein